MRPTQILQLCRVLTKRVFNVIVNQWKMSSWELP